MTDGTIGDRLRELRRGCGLTQEQLAEKAGVSRDMVAKLEQGIRNSARLASLTQLANALGVELTELLRIPSGPPRPLPPRPVGRRRAASGQLAELAAEIRALRAEIRELAEAVTR